MPPMQDLHDTDTRVSQYFTRIVTSLLLVWFSLFSKSKKYLSFFHGPIRRLNRSRFIHKQEALDDIYGIGIYSMEAWDSTLNNIAIVQNKDILMKDLFESESAVIENIDSDANQICSDLKCTWSS